MVSKKAAGKSQPKKQAPKAAPSSKAAKAAPAKLAKKAAANVPVKAKSVAKTTKKPAAKVARPTKPAKPAGNRCPASDPFGAPCQNTLRLGSNYCGIHSHLGR